jgi:hypothetical protein
VPVAMRMGNIWSLHGQVEQKCNRCRVARMTRPWGGTASRMPPLAVYNGRPFVRSSLWAADYMQKGSGV